MTTSHSLSGSRPVRRRRKTVVDPGSDTDAAPGSALPRLREVAEAAGVSTASVSRALNSPDSVSEALRARVDEAAARLGYVADGAGRTLASRRSGLIGVLVAALDEPERSPLLAGLERRFAEAGYFLLVCAATPAAAAHQGRAIIAKGVEGLVLAGLAPSPELLALTASRRIPCVAAGAAGTERMLGVGLDLACAGETVARYLFDLGHRRFALLVPDVDARATVGARTTALRNALHALPACTTLEWGVPQGDAYFAGRVATGAGLDRMVPTAIICPDDRLAVGSLHACQAAGIPVPAGISIVGFGDSAGARQSQPPLTTLRDPLAEIGWAAADILLSRLAGADGGRPAIGLKLIVRGTSGPSPRQG